MAERTENITLLLPEYTYRACEVEIDREAAPSKDADPNAPIEFDAVLATETPVLRGGMFSEPFDEVLQMSGMQPSKADPLPMFFGHNRNDLPIGTWQNLRIDGRSLRLLARGSQTRTTGTVRSKMGESDQPIEAMRALLRSREMRGVSIGANPTPGKRLAPRVLEPGESMDGGFKAGERRMIIIRSWTPFEASLLPNQADPNCMMRSAEDPAGRLIGTTCERVLRTQFPVPDMEKKPMTLEEALKAATGEQVRAALLTTHPAVAETLRGEGRATEREYGTKFADAVKTADADDQSFYRAEYYGEPIERIAKVVERDVRHKFLTTATRKAAGGTKDPAADVKTLETLRADEPKLTGDMAHLEQLSKAALGAA
jgi:hypothetical protein